jgi:lysophospholipase
MNSEIKPFLAAHGQYRTLVGIDGLMLATYTLQGTGPKGDVMISSGQGEFIPKYFELAYDLIQRGYSAVHIMEHRGQGASARVLSEQPNKGSVENFADFSADLQQFVNLVRSERPGQKLFLIGHSMGSAISMLTLIDRFGGEKVFSAAALSAPMFAVRAPVARDTRLLLPLLHALCATEKGCDAYAPGQSKFNLYLKFEDNLLTHSENRWKMHQSMLRENADLGIHGPTNRWTLEATKAVIRIAKLAPPENLPLVIFQAGEDRVVLPEAQTKFCAKSKNCHLVKVPGARHEILQERDSRRTPVLDQIDALFSAQ